MTRNQRWGAVLVVIVGGLLLASITQAAGGGRVPACRTLQTCRNKVVRLEQAVAWQRQSRISGPAYQESIDAAFQVAEIVYGMPRWKAAAIGTCESHLNARERNSATATGVMQEIDSTFARTPFSRVRIPHLYAAFDPWVNILAAGYIWQRDGGSFHEWDCSRIVGIR